MRKNRVTILRRTEKEIIRAMSGVELTEKKSSKELFRFFRFGGNFQQNSLSK